MVTAGTEVCPHHWATLLLLGLMKRSVKYHIDFTGINMLVLMTRV